jgi:hypothetical protein
MDTRRRSAWQACMDMRRRSAWIDEEDECRDRRRGRECI